MKLLYEIGYRRGARRDNERCAEMLEMEMVSDCLALTQATSQTCARQGLFNVSYGLFNANYGLFNVSYGLFNANYGLFNANYGLFNESYSLFNESYGLLKASYGLFKGCKAGLLCYLSPAPLLRRGVAGARGGK